MPRVLINGKTYFEGTGYYGGQYRILGRISEEHMEYICELLDTYTELRELLEQAKQKEMESKKNG